MPKRLKSNFFWLLYSASSIAISFRLFWGWGLMVSTLFLFVWLFRITSMEANLGDREQRLYRLTLILYPPLETVVLWLKTRQLVFTDFNWLNRLEHFCWATVLTFLFLPLISLIWQRLAPWQNFLFVLGFVSLLGNFNEFFEYANRIPFASTNPLRFAGFYSDTIYDMIMNLLGSIVGFGCLWLVNPHTKGQVSADYLRCDRPPVH